MNDQDGNTQILIIGLGNVLLGDDGFGVHAVRRLADESHRLRTHLLEVGTCALHFQDEVEGADVVIAVDAVQAGGEPGTVYLFDLDQSTNDSNRCLSLHDLGIVGLLTLVEPSRRPRTVVVGVEPERTGLTTELTPTVNRALPVAVELVHILFETLRRGDGVDLQDVLASAKAKTLAC